MFFTDQAVVEFFLIYVAALQVATLQFGAFYNMQYVKMVAGNFRDIYDISSVQVVHLSTDLIY